MPRTIPDDYRIRDIKRHGYPAEYADPPQCPRCGGLLGDYVFDIGGDLCCDDCFKEDVLEYLSTNPKEVAKALRYEYHYRG